MIMKKQMELGFVASFRNECISAKNALHKSTKTIKYYFSSYENMPLIIYDPYDMTISDGYSKISKQTYLIIANYNIPFIYYIFYLSTVVCSRFVQNNHSITFMHGTLPLQQYMYVSNHQILLFWKRQSITVKITKLSFVISTNI